MAKKNKQVAVEETQTAETTQTMVTTQSSGVSSVLSEVKEGKKEETKKEKKPLLSEEDLLICDRPNGKAGLLVRRKNEILALLKERMAVNDGIVELTADELFGTLKEEVRKSTSSKYLGGSASRAVYRIIRKEYKDTEYRIIFPRFTGNNPITGRPINNRFSG